MVMVSFRLFFSGVSYCFTLPSTLRGMMQRVRLHLQGMVCSVFFNTPSTYTLCYYYYYYCRMRLLVLRGIFGFLAISSMFWSLSVMSMQDAMVFLYLTPCLVAASSPVVLGQPVHKATYISIPVAFVGVMLVAKPPLIFGSQPGVKPMGLTEFLIGCSQALFATLTKLSVTILGSTEPISHIIASVAIVSCIGSITGSIFILHDWLLPHSLVDVGYFLGVGLCACLVQLAGTLALQRGNASSVMAISYSGIVWSILLDYVVFHTVPQMWGILGAALIIASNLGLVMTRQE